MKTAILIIALAGLYSCASTKRTTLQEQRGFAPDDKNLYDTILRMDSLFFGAYNTCNVNLAAYASYYDDDVEFYHDKGGLSKSKKEIVESTRTNVCGKVKRVLVAGSIEVYPIANYGAIEIGYHTFQNNTEAPAANPHPGRFVVIWRRAAQGWKISRVISLH